MYNYLLLLELSSAACACRALYLTDKTQVRKNPDGMLFNDFFMILTFPLFVNFSKMVDWLMACLRSMPLSEV